MSMRFASIDCLPAKWRDQAAKQLGVKPNGKEKKGTNKYGAKKVSVDGILFDSKREARYYELLKLQLKAGEIKSFHRQVMFDLPGGVIYRCDFLVFHKDGTYKFIDAKGVRTKEFAIKRRLVRATHGVEIVLV